LILADSSSDKIDWLWKQIEKARREKNNEVVRESLERLLADTSIRNTSDEDLAVLNLSQLDISEGRSREAALRLSDFKWHGVPGPAGLLLVSDAYLQLEWFEQAREGLEDYLKLIPEDLDARRKLGLVHLMLNNDEEAQRILLATARREKYRIPATLTYLAMLEAKSGRIEESLHLLLQARELAPYDQKIEHTLLRIESLRVSLKRKALHHEDLPIEDLVAGMVSGMMELHGYSRDKSRQALDVWNKFCSVNTPEGRKPAIWAAAIEYAVTKYGPHFTQKQLADEYGVSTSQLGEHYHTLTEVVDLDSLIKTDLLGEVEKEGYGLHSLVRREEMAEVIATIAGRLDEFDGPGEVCSWVFERIEPINETERREIENFLSYLWKRK
jgi:tetratricopeptide (TPR) repeat protein